MHHFGSAAAKKVAEAPSAGQGKPVAFRFPFALALGVAAMFCSQKAAAAHPHVTVRAGHYAGRLWTAVANDGDVKITRIKWVVRFVEGPTGEQRGTIRYVLRPGRTLSFISNLEVPPTGQHWRADHLILAIYAGGKWIDT
jgi:hypothetical protein